MIKKTQRIIIWTIISFTTIIIILFGILMFGSKSLYSVEATPENLQKLTPEYYQKQMQALQISFVILASSLIVISTVIAVILSKSIMRPLNKLVESAELIIKGESKDIKYLRSNDKKDQIDDLVEGFAGINAELKEKLNETQRKKNEIETVLVHMTDGVISFDIKGNITHINPAAMQALDVNENDSFEYIFKKLGIEFNMEKIIYMEKWASQNKTLSIDDRTYNILFAPIKNESDFADGIIVVIQDITEHIKLNQMRKTFVADVSHELKTPITSILGYSEILLDEQNPVDEKREKRFKQRIMHETLRMHELVQDLLILSKYDAETVPTKKEDVELTEIVKDRVESFQEEAQEKNITLKSFVTTPVPTIYANTMDIDRIITNIISNAIKYTEENGEVNVYVGFLYNKAYIKVRDNGIGIKKEDLEKIFERFYRVESSRVRVKGGSGLGLSIVKEILEKNDGDIDINSEFGKGTEVILRLPIKQEID